MILFGRDLSTELLVVAEVGQNHEGSVDKAKELIAAAIAAGADVAKLQSFTPTRLCSRADAERLARLERFALNEDQQLDVFEWARANQFPLFSTPATEDWVEFVHHHSEGVVKIASGDSTFLPTVRRAIELGATLILSTGGTTVDELDGVMAEIRGTLGGEALDNRLALMQCVSCYPPPVAQANFGAIPFLRSRYGVHVGFSNHFVEPAVPLAAVACGASILELHVTDSRRNREFRDHALSWEPEQLSTFIPLARQLRQASLSPVKEVQPCESTSLSAMRKGVIAVRDLPAGHELRLGDLAYARHEEAAPWNKAENYVGARLKSPVGEGHPLNDDAVEPPMPI